MFTWLPGCNSLRTRPPRVEPEIWIRLVRGASDGRRCIPEEASREQTAEIALEGHRRSSRRRITVALARNRLPQGRIADVGSRRVASLKRPKVAPERKGDGGEQ